MKKVSFLLLALALVTATRAQKLTGLWYSADSTRVYQIKQTADNKFIAVIQSSARKADSVGYVVINNMQYNTCKKRYEGIIYATADNKTTLVKITFDKNNINKIILTLNRMFLLNVAINWVRATA